MNMAFTTIPQALVTLGKAVKAVFGQQVKDNFDDHETRISANELALQSFDPHKWGFQDFQVDVITGKELPIRIKIAFDERLLGARIHVVKDGSVGTLEIDVQRSTDGGATFNSIFTTRPSIAAGGGDDGESINAVFDEAEREPDLNDLLAITVITTMTGSGAQGFWLELDRERRTA